MCMTTFRQVGVVHPDHDGSRETLPTEQQRFLRCQQSQQKLLVLQNKKEETGILWIRLRNHIWLWCLCMAYNFQQIWRQACVSLTHHHHWNVESFQQSLEEAVVVVPTTTGDAAVGNDHLQEWKQPPPPMSGILRESKYRNPKRNHRKQQFRAFLHVHRPRSKRKLLILCSSSSSLDDVDDNSMSTTETNKNNDTRATNKKRVTFAAGFVTSTMIIINTTHYKPTRNRNKRSDIVRPVSNTTIIVSEESLDSHTFQQ